MLSGPPRGVKRSGVLTPPTSMMYHQFFPNTGENSAILREIQNKGGESRTPRRVNFRKVARGKFALAR